MQKNKLIIAKHPKKYIRKTFKPFFFQQLIAQHIEPDNNQRMTYYYSVIAQF